MKRRNFLISAATMHASSLALAEEKPSSKTASYRIVLIDPRLVAKTKERISVGYENKKSDIMGSVHLSYEESAELKAILAAALTTSTNVPFCGHSPAYVIQFENGRGGSYVSVCGLCMTWCGADGNLRVLDGTQLMPLLAKILPLPAAFSKVKELHDLFKLDRKKSFLELPTPK